MADNSELMTTVDPHEYAQSYESRDPDYIPTDAERALIEDALCGYLSIVAAPRVPVTAEAGEVSEAVTDQNVYDALHARAPGGAEVWLWLPQEADEPDNPHTARPNRTAYEVMRAALETLAARRVQPKQDTSSPDVAGLIEAGLFLLDRLSEFAPELDEDGEAFRDFDGYVSPAMARFRVALSRGAHPRQDAPSLSAGLMHDRTDNWEQQDDARDSTVGADGGLPEAVWAPLARLQSDAGYLAGRVAADGSAASMVADTIRMLAEAAEKEIRQSLASARADGVREGLELAAQKIDDFAKAAVLVEWEARAKEYRAYAAAIRALIKKDARGPDAH